MESMAGGFGLLRVFRCFALVGVVVAALSACATPGTSTDSYDLVLNAPGLETLQPKVVVTHDGDYSQVKRSTWNASHATWPQADLIFWRIKDTFRNKQVYIHEDSLPEFIGTFLPGEDITLGAVGSTKNVLGDLSFQRFSRSQFAECIFIEQGISRFSDQVGVIGSGEPLGDMVVRGWYCVGSTEPNQDAAFQGFIAGIGIAGWSLPLSMSPQKKQDDVLLIYADYGTPNYRTDVTYRYLVGLDIGRPGDTIIAAADGTVDFVASSANSEWIIIYHGRGDDGQHMRTGYAWHQTALVKEGDPVTRGQVIGIVGGSKSPHIRFSVAKAPENVSGPSSAWIYENPHDYWIDGPGKTTCYEPGKSYPQKLSMKFTWPLKCR